MMGLEDWFGCGCTISEPNEKEPAVEYGTETTPLYRAIETRQWASVNNFLKTGFWKNSFFPDRVKPLSQSQTWVVRYETRDDQTKVISWKQLPIHAAIVYGAPAIIVQKLIKMYPKSIRYSDARGNLPIHMAFRHGSNDAILALLLQEYPESMNCREDNGLLPTECSTDMPSPQPLRGALLKTTLGKESKDEIAKKFIAERLFFDERPPNADTPQNNISSTKSRQSTDSHASMEVKDKQIDSPLSFFSKKMDDLKSTVARAMNGRQEEPCAEVAGSDDAANYGPHPSSQKTAPMASTPQASVGSKKPLDPIALDDLRNFVSQTLAASSHQDPDLEVVSDHNVSGAVSAHTTPNHHHHSTSSSSSSTCLYYQKIVCWIALLPLPNQHRNMISNSRCNPPTNHHHHSNSSFLSSNPPILLNNSNKNRCRYHNFHLPPPTTLKNSNGGTCKP
jgi:hypothetical protein